VVVLKYFITDIHGDCRGLMLLLKHANIDFSKDQLVIGGDMINRGKESGEVVREIKAMHEKFPDNVRVLIGNHEEMMIWYYQNGDTTWLAHGGSDTIQSFNKTFPDEAVRNDHIEWLGGLPLYFEDEEFVYIHAGLNPYEPLDKQNREILWMAEDEFYTITRDSLLFLTRGRAIVHGHTPVVEYIYHDGARINCDLGSNTYCIESERALALVNLSMMTYYVYKQSSRKIEERKVTRI
jgi:serine/threonine protein phosphatase 1